MLPTIAGALAFLLLLATVGLVVQTGRVAAANARADRLAAEVDELRAEVERLQADDATTEQPDPLEDLFGSGDIDDLLGGLLGEEGEGLLDDLLGGGEMHGAACLTPDDLDLGGLFGGGSSLPSDPDQLVEVIADQVAELRELEWEHEVEVDFLEDAELRARLDELITESADPDALAAEARLLEALGALPPGTDLEQLQRDLLGEQVAGFYSPETGELVVRVGVGGEIRPLDRITIAHELEHALADQVLGLPDLEEGFTDDPDGQLAAMAAVEGDATLLMNLWALEHVPLTEQLEGMMSGDLAAAQRSLEAVPYHLQQELMFPYTEGLELACDRYQEGGWSAVDATYHDERPRTTAEVLFGPAAGDPAAPRPLDGPAGYDELRTGTFGAAPLSWLFEAPGGEPDRALDRPRDRAAAWNGGQATVWEDGTATAVGLALVDGGGDVALCDSVDAWYAAAFPGASRLQVEGAVVFEGDDTAVLRCVGGDVLLGVAADLATATEIVGD